MAENTDNKKLFARHLYVEKCYTAKDVASQVGVSEQTIGKWVKDGGWKELRSAGGLDIRKRSGNVESIINSMAEQRIQLEKQIQEEERKNKPDHDRIRSLREEITRIDFGVCNWNKTLTNINKESKTTITQYIYVMEDIFKAMMRYDYKLYMTTVAFQEHLVSEISNRDNL